jgi:hypothetical protein
VSCAFFRAPLHSSFHSDFAIELGNQHSNRKRFDETKYPNDEVIAPGTVIISAAGNCSNITKVVEPVLQTKWWKHLLLKLITRCF